MRNELRLSRKPAINNHSGQPGVHWDKKARKWYAKLVFKRELLYLGGYDLFRDAVKARKQAEQEYLTKGRSYD